MATVILSVVVAAGIGWFAGSRIKSPADRAAETAPPAPSNITVEVVETELTADVVTRGDVVFDQPAELELSGSFAVTPDRLVVTESHQIGDELVEGSVVVEVAGRPVFLLAGDLPVYRDLRPGARGDDVLQLEQALARLGYLEADPDDTWDPATGAAVAAWYAAAGYLSNGLSPDDEQALSAARSRLRGAQGSVADLESSLRQAQQGSGQSAVTQARVQVSQAENALGLAELDASHALEVAKRRVKDAEAAVNEAEKGLAEAAPADKPAAQVAFDEALSTLDQAEFDQDRTELEQSALLQAAMGEVTVAKAGLADAQRGVDTGPLRRQLSDARLEQTEAQEVLVDLEATLGVWLPAGEVVFLSAVPVVVNEVHAERGSTVSGPYLTVTGSDLYVRSSVGTVDAPRIEPGMPAQIEHPVTGELLSATIRFVAERPGTNEVPPDRIYIELEPVDSLTDIVGANVRVVIPVSSTGGPVLAVPTAALSATADGSVILQVEEEDGTLRVVEVGPGLSADGLVEVTAIDGELDVDDRVVVGYGWAAESGSENADTQ